MPDNILDGFVLEDEFAKAHGTCRRTIVRYRAEGLRFECGGGAHSRLAGRHPDQRAAASDYSFHSHGVLNLRQCASEIFPLFHDLDGHLFPVFLAPLRTGSHQLSVFLPYSGITCMVDVPGTGPGIGTGAGPAD